MVSVTHSPPRPKNVKWKVPEISNSQVLNCAPSWVAWWNLTPSLICAWHPPPSSWFCDPGSPKVHDPLPDIWSGQRQPHSPGHCLRHPAYCVSLRRHLIIRHRHQKRRDGYSTMRGFERDRPHSHDCHHTMVVSLGSVLLLAIVTFLQCLICKLNFIICTVKA